MEKLFETLGGCTGPVILILAWIIIQGIAQIVKVRALSKLGEKAIDAEERKKIRNNITEI